MYFFLVILTKLTFSSVNFVLIFIFKIRLIFKKEERVLDETPGLNNPETYVFTHNRFNTYLVLKFIDINKAQIYKKPFRNNPHHEIGILMSFKYLNFFKPSEHTDDY